MAKLRVYPAGDTGYIPTPHPRTPPPPGQRVVGWSRDSTRRMVAFLYSVDVGAIPGGGLSSYSLTVRDCPPTPEDFKRLRTAFFKRIERLGVVAIFWLIEWQRRQVPHLHGIVVLPAATFVDLCGVWVRTCADFCVAVSAAAQDQKPIYDAQGWSEYLGKHSARGVSNYQRSSASIPRAWRDGTGRMWGKRGDWPTRAPLEFAMPRDTWHRLRRLRRRHAIAQARSRSDWRAVSRLRRSLKCSNAGLSPVRGMSRFVPLSVTLQLLAAVDDGRVCQC